MRYHAIMIASVIMVAIVGLSATGVARAADQNETDIKNAVDFRTGCEFPSAIYKPPYPAFNAEGPAGHSYAVLFLIVTTEGLPIDIHVQSGSSSESQAIHAMQLLNQWKFKPATCNGSVVAMKISIRQEFNVCPSTGCVQPEASINPAIAGLRLPKLPAPRAPMQSSTNDLIQEHQRRLRFVKSVEDILNTRSFVARARIACRSQQVAFPRRRPDRSGKLITAVHGYSTPPPAGWLAAIHRGSLSEPIDPESP